MPAEEKSVQHFSGSDSLPPAAEGDVECIFYEDHEHNRNNLRAALLPKKAEDKAEETCDNSSSTVTIRSASWSDDDDTSLLERKENGWMKIGLLGGRKKLVIILFSFVLVMFCCFCCLWRSSKVSSPEFHWSDFQTEFDMDIARSGLLVSRAAYCEPEKVLNWTCEVCQDYLPTFQLYNIYQNDTVNTLGLSGVLPEERLIVVAFRGTRNVENWIKNLKFFMRQYIVHSASADPQEEMGNSSGGDEEEDRRNNECQDCAVHTGFYEAFESMQTQLQIDVALLREQYPQYKVLITGHSLGAAIAHLSALDLLTLSSSSVTVKRVLPTSNQGMKKGGTYVIYESSRVREDAGHLALNATPPQPGLSLREVRITPIESDRLLLYTFGSPRVGNANFSQWANLMLSSSYRLTHNRDIIPHVPPASLGYRHVPHEIYFSNESDLLSFHHCNDNSRYTSVAGVGENIYHQHRRLYASVRTEKFGDEHNTNGDEDPTCSSGVWGATFSDHKMYLGMTTACRPDDLAS